MYKENNINPFDFLKEDKFLGNILELRNITDSLLQNREEMLKNVERLQATVQLLYREIHASDNK